jgi:hypothetical protein
MPSAPATGSAPSPDLPSLRPLSSMRELYREFVKFFVSLKLTVALLALSALLVFLATIDQVHLGIWAVQEKWFKSLIVLQDIRGIPVPIFPGGYFIGALLLINLVAAHAKRFVMSWKKAGIQLVHFGLILLLLGEFFTGIFQEEYQMRLDEGETKNYSESWRFNELAVIDVTSPEKDIVTALPEKRLARLDRPIGAAELPFQIVPRLYFPNATLGMAGDTPPNLRTVAHGADRGLGPRLLLAPLPITYEHNKRNLPAAALEIIGAEGSIGTFLVSPMLVEPERFTYAGREWSLALRFEREYKPYSVTLLEFTHDRYAGTEIPKNFSSRVRLTTPDGVTDREVLIFMNNPLRHDGMTFYQAGFDNNDRTTILQVVRNPSWIIPYLSCLLMSAGLYWQFGWHLALYTARRGNKAKGDSGTPALDTAPGAIIAAGLVLSMRVFAALIGLWITAGADGTPAAIGLSVLILEFLVCTALFLGLAKRSAWTPPLLSAYAWVSLVILSGVFAYGFMSNDIYDAILRWVVVGLHAITAAALLGLARGFSAQATAAWFAPARPAAPVAG